MAFRIHKGIFQSKNASNVYENKFKIDDESGALIAVDAQGAQTGSFLKTTDVATDSNLLDGLDSTAFLRTSGGTLTGQLNMHASSYEGSIVFGSASTWRTGIRQHDDADAELRIWAKNASGMIFLATGYDGEPADIARPTDGLAIQGNKLGIGDFSAADPSYKLHVKGDIYANGGWVRVSGTKGLYFESYGGGWNMSDSTWIRAYNNKSIYTGGNIEATGSVRADSGVHDANTRFVIPGGASSVGNPSGTGGAIKIELPVAAYGINTMMSMTVQVYEYSTGQSFTIRCGGYNYYSHDWYNVFAYLLNDSGKGSNVPVYFGNDGTRDVIWIGNSDWSWSYPNVFVTDFQAGHTTSGAWRTGWRVIFDTAARTNVTASRTAHRQIDTGNIGSQSVNYATTAGTANAVAWGNITSVPSSFTPSAHNHDDRYYTESEVDTLLDGKQDSGSYAASSHSHAISDVTGLQTALDNKQASGSYASSSSVININSRYNGTIAADGWYTIATYGSGRALATFHLYDTDSSRHNYVEAKITWSYGNGGVHIVNSGRHGTSTIKHIRLLYNTSNQTYGGVKVQVYCENASWTLKIRQEYPNDIDGWGSFSQVTPVLENSIDSWAEYSRAYNVNDQGVISTSSNAGWLAGNAIATQPWVSANYQAAGSYAAASHTHDDRYYTETEVNTLLAGKLSTTGKAADAETVDGIDSSRIVYGDGANGRSVSRTDGNANTSDSSNASGFYFGTRVAGMPTTDWWNWVTVRGNSWSGSDGYHFQLAGSFWSDDFRIRRMQSGSNKAWVTLMHSGNISSQSVNYASSAGAVAWGNITSVPSSFTPSSHTHNYILTQGNYVWNADTRAGDYTTGIQTSFVRGADGFPDYGAVLHVGARGGNDAGGDFQIYCGHGSANGGNYLRVRNADNNANPSDSWTDWRVIWDSGNFDPDSKAAASHTHDDRYYTESEVDTLLDGKQDSGSYAAASHTHGDLYYTESEVDTLLSGKAASSHTHGIGSVTDASRWWNNFGNNHATRTSFDAAGTALSTGFGWRYVQGAGNSPGWGSVGSGQYYALTVGLGNDYDYNLYGMQMTIPRNSTTPYLSVRFEENRVLGAWQKISAGYADSAGAVAWGNVSGKPSTFSPSAHTHDDRYYTESEVDTLLAGKQATGTYLTSLPSHDHSSITGSAAEVSIRGYGSNSFSFQQTSGSFAGYTGWANHFIGNHGNGSTYYNTVHIMPFWDVPRYSRLEGGEFNGVYQYWTEENFTPSAKADKAGSSSVTFSASDMNVHAWTRIHGGNGIYFQTYGYGLRSPNGEGVTYGNIATYGTGRNGWSGYSVGNWISLMAVESRRGLFLTDTDRWLIKYDGGDAFSDYEIQMGSDARNKSNVQNLTGSLDKVKALRGVSYNYKNQERTSLGFIAQEVKQVIPEVVSADSEGYYAIGYQSLIAVLSEAIKEQQTIIDALTARVEALENNR
jgi:hypothetical protein